MVLAIVFVFISVGSAFLLPLVPRTMIHVGLPVSLLYNVYLKRFIVFKNLFTGLANTGVILVGSLLTDNFLEPFAVFLAVLGFLFSYSYEIMLDIMDVAGDRVNSVETIPSRFGIEKAALISVSIGVATILVSPLPFIINLDHRLFHDPTFLVIAGISMIDRAGVLGRLQVDQSPENIRKLKKHMFRNLQISGLGYLIGILV
jgi:4-hydroxybenzoate polyprenyltransferase